MKKYVGKYVGIWMAVLLAVACLMGSCGLSEEGENTPGNTQEENTAYMPENSSELEGTDMPETSDTPGGERSAGGRGDGGPHRGRNPGEPVPGGRNGGCSAHLSGRGGGRV